MESWTPTVAVVDLGFGALNEIYKRGIGLQEVAGIALIQHVLVRMIHRYDRFKISRNKPFKKENTEDNISHPDKT